MKIAVNGRGLIKKYTGIGIVTRHLLREMAKAYEDIEFLLFISDKTNDDYSGFFPTNVKIIKLRELDFLGERFSKLFFEQISFPWALKKEKADLALFPYPCNPFYKTSYLSFVIAHDAIPWKISEYNKSFFSKQYNDFSKRNLHKADIVFTVSKYSKRDLLKVCGLNEDKVKVIYNDCADSFKEKIDEKISEKLMKKLGIEKGKYFIYCGGYDERKNVKQLISEYKKFSSKWPDIKLVLVGEKIFGDKLYSSFEDAKKEKNIVFSGNVSDEELNSLYSNAISLVHLSREEGFNLPIVEASNCDCPLILSDIEVHREIAGNDACFVDTNIEGDGAKKMEKMMDQEFREKALEISRKIAGNYLWERSALRYMDIILTKFKNE